MKKYVFFYHYNKQAKKMTVHFRDSCTLTQNVICQVPCETKWNKRQPNLVMKGKCKEIEIQKDQIIIK